MKPHRLIILGILALAIASTALAHGGHKHQFLGTVNALHENHLVITTTTSEEVTFTLTDATRYTKGTAVATKADLKSGVRVSVYVENDGKTAKTIKIAE